MSEDSVTWARLYQEDLREAMESTSKCHPIRNHHLSLPPSFKIWTPPHLNSYKLNVDGAIRTESCKVGWGAVIRDHCGRVLACGAQNQEACLSSEIVEAPAILKGIRFAEEMGLTPVEVHSDCQAVVKLINSSEIVAADVGIIISDIHSLLFYCVNGKIYFTPRNTNSVAHILAKFSLDIPTILFGLTIFLPLWRLLF